jgi:hypothetical protein
VSHHLTQQQRRAASAAVLLVLGGLIAAATWVGGDHGFAIGLVVFYVVASLVAWVVSGGTSDVAAIMRVGGDERQRVIDREATAVAGYAMVAVAITGTIVQLARGEDPGVFAWMCTVAGVAYVIALGVLRARR